MRLESIRTLPGPNVYIDRPVVRVRIELEELTDKESSEFPGFTDRLLERLPGLREHHCAKGEPGGFVERLEGGTYFGHIVEHTAIELSQQAGIDVTYGKTLYAGAPGRYDMIVEYKNEPAIRFLLPVAKELVEAVLRDAPYPLDARLAEARRIVAHTELGPSTRAIVDAAERRGIPWIRLNEGSLVQLGQGIHRRTIEATQSDRTSATAVDIACDKEMTKHLLDAAAIPVPRGILARSREQAVAALDELRAPLVIKPLDGNQGKGISLRLHTPEDLAGAFDLAAAVARPVIVEEYFAGRDYRIVVINGKMVAAAERVPAHVIGDGRQSIRALVEAANRDPRRGEGHEKPLTQIVVDAIAEAYLQRQGRTLGDVPAAGERVFLRETANLSTGGTACDVTDRVHPSIARMCERAARVIGLDICGVDLIVPDIGRPLPSDGGAGIVEVNAAPGIRMHHHPSSGKPRDVGAAIVDMLFPAGSNGRIPTVAITGTNGKTTVTRMIAHAVGATGRTVGMTTTDGIWIGNECIARGDLTGFHSARVVHSDPTVEMAVLETARGGIVRRSLGYDWSDVGVLTNVQADHLGQDGIETVDDLLWVKALVAERVRPGGTIVLNADDERLAKLPDRPRIRRHPRTICFFSLSDENPVVQRHLAAGGTAYFVRDGHLVEATGNAVRPIVPESALPCTFGGLARFQTANALAALAACRALGLNLAQAATALRRFGGAGDNPGRMNVYRVERGYVIVDYGHNPGAFEALCSLTAAYPERTITGIFTAPGDRTNELIEATARRAAHCFDRLIIREDEDLRGRRAGEVPEMLYRVVRAEAPDKPCRIIRNEAAALRTALEQMEEDELIVFFYEKQTEPSLSVLGQFGGHPVTAIDSVPVHQTI